MADRILTVFSNLVLSVIMVVWSLVGGAVLLSSLLYAVDPILVVFCGFMFVSGCLSMYFSFRDMLQRMTYRVLFVSGGMLGGLFLIACFVTLTGRHALTTAMTDIGMLGAAVIANILMLMVLSFRFDREVAG